MAAPTGQDRPATGQRPPGCYIYGIVPADVTVTADARGVGDPPGTVQVVRHDGIAALVSEVDVQRPLGRPEDLMAHEHLLDSAAAEAPVLPMRFGTVMTAPDAVADELLAPHRDEFRAALEELEGHAEFVVKGRYEQEMLLAEVLAENPEAGRLAAEIRGTDEDASRPQRIRLGELISEAVTAKRQADTRRLGQVAEPYCTASAVREPTHEEDAVHAAFLVRTDAWSGLERAVADLAREWEGHVTLRLLGPLAAYDFVTSQEGGA